MADERLTREEEVEEILRLAVRESTGEGEDLREQMRVSAAELGISEEQLRVAEEKYFAERDAEALRDQERRARRLEILKMAGFGVLGVALVGLGLALMDSGSGGFCFVGAIAPALFWRQWRQSGDRQRDDA
ncbi:hypothetical protein CCB80_00535 [Armatimonadetes bacterium Uphvl-Ar1]|nr:hypothetical protein CCB80_00535 [Armatimonadetes bacterium Uphvl-Ar1]